MATFGTLSVSTLIDFSGFPTRHGAEMALTAFERALAKSPRKDHRHRIEHVGDLEPQPDLLERMRSSEIIPVTTPQFTWSYGDQAPESAATPLATLHRLGFLGG